MKPDLTSFLPKFAAEIVGAGRETTTLLELYINDDGTPAQSAEAIGLAVGTLGLRRRMTVPDVLDAAVQTAAHFARKGA